MRKINQHTVFRASFALLSIAASFALGCSDEGSSSTEDPSGNVGGAGGENEGPLYAITTQLFDGESYTSYILVTSSLDSVSPRIKDGIEIEGRAIGAGPDEGGQLFVGTHLSPEIIRYDLDASGKLEEAGRFSFLPAGLSQIGEYQGQFYFVNDEKAYFFDGSTGRLVVFNPAKMTYEKSILLDSLVFEDELLTFGNTPVLVGETLMVFPGWRSSDNTEVISRAAVLAVDTTNDAIEVATDDRCGYTRDGYLSDDGYVYIATEAFGSAVWAMNSSFAPAPCLLRYSVTEGEFDDDYYFELTELFEEDVDAAGSLVLGPEGQAYLLSLDESLFEGPPVPRVLASSPAWRVAKLTTGDDPKAEPIDASAIVGSLLTAPVGDDVYLPVFQGRESTQFRKFTDEWLSEPTIDVAGLAFSTVKLR